MLPSSQQTVKRPASAGADTGSLASFRYGGHVNVHRLRETINGREYLIEVSSVDSDKWRAQIARVPGGPSAMMPFYGRTPDEAAGQLSHWLALAHGVKRC